MKQKIITVLLAILALLGGGYTATRLGSVEVGNQYQATTTPQIADAVNLCPARSGYASSTTGTLGSVNILNSNTGGFTILDATTTNVDLRLGNTGTSSLILADFLATAEGSYHFDIGFKNGLLVDYSASSNVAGTTTISYRCEG